MKRAGRRAGAALLVLMAAIVVGWIWGASGRGELLRRVDATEQALALSQARAHTLEARVHLHNLDYGRAGQSFEAAKPRLEEAAVSLERVGHTDLANTARELVARLDGVRDRAIALDPAAQGAAGEIAEAITRIEQQLSK